MKLRFYVLLLTITTLVSCNKGYDRPGFYLSNPTDTEIKATINDSSYTIAPHAFTVLRLENGIHELEYNGQKTKFKVFAINNGGIINPTLEPHYIYTQVYATEGNSELFKAPDRNIAIDGVVYTDDIQSTNALFIDNNLYRCTFFLGSRLPETQLLQKGNDLGLYKKKFFTKEEFIKFYDDNIVPEQKGFHQENKVLNGVCTITEPNIVELKLPNVPSKELLASYKEEMELLIEYKNSSESSKQLQLETKIQSVSRNRSNLDNNYNNLTTEQNQSIEYFTQASRRISGAGILSL